MFWGHKMGGLNGEPNLAGMESNPMRDIKTNELYSWVEQSNWYWRLEGGIGDSGGYQLYGKRYEAELHFKACNVNNSIHRTHDRRYNTHNFETIRETTRNVFPGSQIPIKSAYNVYPWMTKKLARRNDFVYSEAQFFNLQISRSVRCCFLPIFLRSY